MSSAYVRPAADRAELLTLAHSVSVDACLHHASSRPVRLALAFTPRAVFILAHDPRTPSIAPLGNPTEESLRMPLETWTRQTECPGAVASRGPHAREERGRSNPGVPVVVDGDELATQPREASVPALGVVRSRRQELHRYETGLREEPVTRAQAQ